MNKDFTLYKEAFELKQLGFGKPCIATIDQTDFVHIKGTEYPIRGAMLYDNVDCPTYSQAFRWFREEHLLEGLVLPQDRRAPDPLPIYFIAVESYENGEMTELFNSTEPKNFLHYYEYEEAELACLRKLIEIVKNEK